MVPHRWAKEEVRPEISYPFHRPSLQKGGPSCATTNFLTATKFTEPLANLGSMTGSQPEELGAEPALQPAAERVWQHPSEVGLETRCRVDQKRAGWIAGSVFLVSLILLGTGVSLGATRPASTAGQAASSPDQAANAALVPAESPVQQEIMARVTVIRRGTATVALALRFDAKGHLLLPAHLVASANEVWATALDGTQEQVQLVDADLATDLAVLRPIRPSSGRVVTAAELPKRAGAVRVMYAAAPAGLVARSGYLAEGDSGTAADPEGALHAELGVQSKPKGALGASSPRPDLDLAPQAADSEMLTAGLVFDSAGEFIGLTTVTEARPVGSSATWVVEILAAETALEVANQLLGS